MEQVNISKDTISISLVLGDLTYDFERKASLSLAHSIMEWSFFLKNYESRALKMMADHYVFFEQLGMISGIIEEEYVTREAIIGCSLGTKDIKLDAYEDHGVIAANQKPLMTCEDCQVNKNIYSFGTCKRTLFGMGLPHPSAISSESVVDLRVRYQCFPILSKEWMQAEGDLRISDLTGDNFVDALRSGAYLTCLYGGLITVKEISMKEESQDEQTEGLLSMESKWLDDEWEKRGWGERKPTIYVTKEDLEQLGWEEIQDYYARKDTGDKWDWTEDYLPEEALSEKEVFEEVKSEEELSEKSIERLLEHIPFKEKAPEIVAHTRSIEEQDIKNLNSVLELYDITTYERISAFMAQITLECDRGEGMCERTGKGKDNKPKSTTRHDMAAWYIKMGRKYLYQYRGGGAIHVTHDYNYSMIEDIVIPPDYELEISGVQGTEFIAFNYPWLSAGIFWNHNKINDALEKDGIDGVTRKIQPRADSESKSKRRTLYEECKEVFKHYTQKNG